MGEIAGTAFDVIIIKEDDNRRGRAPGETAELVEQGVNRTKRPNAVVKIVISEAEAVEQGLLMCRSDDFVGAGRRD